MQTPEEQRQLDWVQQRGRLLYEIDRAAWVTTDDLRARVPDLGAAGVRGWVVERDGPAYLVSYYAGEGDARAVLYRGRVENNRVVAGEVLAARPLLTPAQRRLADARGVVARMGRTPCTRRASTSRSSRRRRRTARSTSMRSPPRPRTGSIRSVAISATVAASGEILSQRAFTNCCLNMGPRATSARDPTVRSQATARIQKPTPRTV